MVNVCDNVNRGFATQIVQKCGLAMKKLAEKGISLC